MKKRETLEQFCLRIRENVKGKKETPAETAEKKRNWEDLNHKKIDFNIGDNIGDNIKININSKNITTKELQKCVER